MDKVTVVGGLGFIGSAVSKLLREKGYSVFIPEKNDPQLFSQDLGTVVYCAGHGDCKNNSLKVFDSNSAFLVKMLEHSKFEKMIYLSSTRLYIDRDSSLESDDLQISTADPRRLFNLTKIVSEEMCEKSGRNVIILRPSNIYGPAINSPLFLPMIVKNALQKKRIDMYVPPEYAKDYLSVDSLADAILQFVKQKSTGFDIFNVASGENVPAKEIAAIIESKTSCEIVWHKGFPGEKFPVTSIDKLKKAIDFKTVPLLHDLENMIDQFSEILNIPVMGKK